MKSKIRIIDWGMVFIFVLWLVSTNFHEMTELSFIAGGLLVVYLIVFAVRRLNNR
jgi:hypothetical protein